MLNITGHLCLMSLDFPLLNSLHFEYDLILYVKRRCFYVFLCHIGHVSWVWSGSFKCVIVLTAFLVEICVMLAQELIIACTVQ